MNKTEIVCAKLISLVKLDRFAILWCVSSRVFLRTFLECPYACPTGGKKVLGTGNPVQLIVFFGAIREILKREIYRMDK
jgi:hypothetical protein